MEYTLTKKDVEKLLNKSSKTITRYIKSGKLRPIKKKVNGYMTYLFSLDDIEELTKGHSGHEGQTDIGQGTNQRTNDNTPTPEKEGGVNILNEGTQGTNHGTKQSKKSELGDIEDRARDTELIDILRDTIGTLKAELEAKNRQIEEEKQHNKDLMNSLQFAQQEAKEYRQMLALPMANTNSKVGDIIDSDQGTEDRTGDKTEGQDKEEPEKKSFFKKLFGL